MNTHPDEVSREDVMAGREGLRGLRSVARFEGICLGVLLMSAVQLIAEWLL